MSLGVPVGALVCILSILGPLYPSDLAPRQSSCEASRPGIGPAAEFKVLRRWSDSDSTISSNSQRGNDGWLIVLLVGVSRSIHVG